MEKDRECGRSAMEKPHRRTKPKSDGRNLVQELERTPSPGIGLELIRTRVQALAAEQLHQTSAAT